MMIAAQTALEGHPYETAHELLACIRTERRERWEAAELTQLDQYILAKAFRGESVSQDPRDEPASQLLDDIRTTRHQAEAKTKVAKRGRTKRGRTKK